MYMVWALCHHLWHGRHIFLYTSVPYCVKNAMGKFYYASHGEVNQPPQALHESDEVRQSDERCQAVGARREKACHTAGTKWRALCKTQHFPPHYASNCAHEECGIWADLDRRGMACETGP
jgi:hypothetical protein